VRTAAPTRDALDLASELEQLADQVGRLRPDWRDGERFYETRSEVIARLRSLARNPPAQRVVIKFIPAVPTPAAPPPPSPTAPARGARRPAARGRLPHPGRPEGQGALWPSST
jgi:hypothetical protein